MSLVLKRARCRRERGTRRTDCSAAHKRPRRVRLRHALASSTHSRRVAFGACLMVRLRDVVSVAIGVLLILFAPIDSGLPAHRWICC